MSQRLEGKACVVTGGGGGIGSATALRFAREGAIGVVIADINFQAAEEVAKEINETYPNRAIALKCDVSKKADAMQSVSICVSKFGRIDVYFANAGVLGKYYPIEDETEESFSRTMEINTLGCFMAIKYASEAMKKCGNGGSIILTSSIASIRADITPLQYAASKGSLLSLVVAANDRLLLDNVRVNALLPGGVMTDMAMGVAKDLDEQGLEMTGYDNARFPFIETDQIASVVLFLASDESTPIKGQFIIADGGMANSMGSQPPLQKKKPKLHQNRFLSIFEFVFINRGVFHCVFITPSTNNFMSEFEGVKRFSELDRSVLDKSSILGFAKEMGTINIDPWKSYVSYSESIANANLSDLGYFLSLQTFGALYGYYYAPRPVFFRQRAVTMSLLLTSYAGFFIVSSRSKGRMLAERREQFLAKKAESSTTL